MRMGLRWYNVISMKKRVYVNYNGSVQGVGFRYTARDVAQRLGVAGWVKNTPDGNVEMVAEGEESVLNELLSEIKREMNYAQFKEQTSWMPATGEFKSFEIKYF